MRRALTLILILAFAPAARAQCLGDGDGNGAVEIHELVSAVNNALNGCGARAPTPTPTRTRIPTQTPRPACPLRFDQSSGQRACRFRGRFTNVCDLPDVDVLFASTGEVLVLGIISTPRIYMGALPISPTAGVLGFWTTDPTFLVAEAWSGSVALTDGGRGLRIIPDFPAFTLDGCDADSFTMSFVGVERAP